MLTCLIAVMALTFLMVVPQCAHSQSPEDRSTLELVDHLKEVIRRAERQRDADRIVLEQLRALVRRYDWPWRAKLLHDDFSDGNYTANPAWYVRRGEFRVVKDFGLHTYVGSEMVPHSGAQERDVSEGGSTFESIVEHILQGTTEPGASFLYRGVLPPAEIYAPVSAGRSFAIRMRLAAGEQNPAGSRFEFGIYRGRAQDWGYRLAYTRNPEPALELLRLSPGRLVEMQRFDGLTGLEGGRARMVELRRYHDGTMLASVEGKELIRLVDHGAGDFFDGFVILNGGGEYLIERVEVYGEP